MASHHLPFLFGAQYYRAPTPSRDCWAKDLDRIRSLGMNSVKYWVQWRWSHREPDRFEFGDLDELMDLAHARELAVHLNMILDVSPHWFYDLYPDAHPILQDGRALGPFEVASRQIGGQPRPCLSHPGSLHERQKFFRTAIEHFRSHPALAAWDVWNEPELCGPARTPDPRNLADYNPHNIRAFRQWLVQTYEGDLQKLNSVWGRCYDTFEQVEPPRTGQTFSDFADWRDFHCDLVTQEANWRFAAVEELDPGRLKFLHVVPSVRMWNAVGSATDDAALTANADLFASTGAGTPWWQPQIAGCANGRTAWNTEVHIAHGRTSVHQRISGSDTVRRELLPQIGGGISGFQFWQFKPESLGLESPACGLVRLDGTDRPLTVAIETFWKKLSPHAERIAACHPTAPVWALWRSRRNEFVHAAMHGSLDRINTSYQAWLKAMHWRSFSGRMVNTRDLQEGKLAGLKLLIMTEPYFLSHEEARAIADWVESGGVLISEAHLGAYDSTTGRHSASVPGCGLAERLGLREVESTAVSNLRAYCAEFVGREPAFADSGRTALFDTSAGVRLPGADRYAEIGGESVEALAWLERSKPVAVRRKFGGGEVFYLGTNVGLGAELAKTDEGLQWVLDLALDSAGLVAPGGISTDKGGMVRVDHLIDDHGQLAYVVAHNYGTTEQSAVLATRAELKGVYDGETVAAGAHVRLPAESAELYAVIPKDTQEELKT